MLLIIRDAGWTGVYPDASTNRMAMRERGSVMTLSNGGDGENHATRQGKSYVEQGPRKSARTAAPVR
jgi:hypothetical protein